MMVVVHSRLRLAAFFLRLYLVRQTAIAMRLFAVSLDIRRLNDEY